MGEFTAKNCLWWVRKHSLTVQTAQVYLHICWYLNVHLSQVSLDPRVEPSQFHFKTPHRFFYHTTVFLVCILGYFCQINWFCSVSALFSSTLCSFKLFELLLPISRRGQYLSCHYHKQPEPKMQQNNSILCRNLKVSEKSCWFIPGLYICTKNLNRLTTLHKAKMFLCSTDNI